MAASALKTSSLPEGTTVGPYRLEGLIGKGGMGAVYRATQLTLNRPVALKILHPKRSKDEKALADFMREAKVAAALDHQNLVPIYDVGVYPNNGLAYYSMKLVVGRSLNMVIAQEGLMTWERVRPWMEQLAAAIGHAHNRNVVHRDIKPGNILLTAEGQIVLTDLGLALDRFAGHKATSKRILKLVGTAEYAAPEQLRNPDKATSAADVWAIGATAYYLMTGQDPFTGETLLDLVVSVATDEPAHLPKLPDPGQSVIRKLMQKSPGARPQDGFAARNLIQGYDSQGPVQSDDEPLRPVPNRITGVHRRNNAGSSRYGRRRRR